MQLFFDFDYVLGSACGRTAGFDRLWKKKAIDFGVQPFKKGLVGVERAKPSACTLFRLSKTFPGCRTD